MNNKDKQLSKSLSWILRHGAKKEGISISFEGYIEVDILLQHKLFKQKYHKEDIERVVLSNDKQRFKLRLNPTSNRLEIKANQGHSISDIIDTELTPILEPKYPTVVHGTYFKHWPIIQQQGLSRMTRNHIHFSKGTLEDNVVSGVRKGVELYIFIDLEKALDVGLKFYESENGVILTPGNDKGFLDPKLFLKVVEVKTGFPPGTTSSDLQRVFSKYGLMRVLQMQDGNAIIWFQHTADAEKALTCPTTDLCGYFLKLVPNYESIPNYVYYNKNRYKGPVHSLPGNNGPASSNGGQPGVGRRSRKKRRNLAERVAAEENVWKLRQGVKKRWKEIEQYKAEGQMPLIDPKELDLSGDFNTQVETVINSIRLSREEVEKLYSLYLDVEHSLQNIWPDCLAVPFGSITTGLGIKSSDADCFIKLPVSELPATSAHILTARDILLRHPDIFARVVAVPNAATPIVKCFHVPTSTYCDISMRTSLGVRNSRLVAHLLAADDKFGPLALLLKYWARVRQFSGTGKFTNYTLVLMLIFYLQRAGRLPSVRSLQNKAHSHSPAGNWDAGFSDDRSLLPVAAPVSLRKLLSGFFRFYATFDFTKMIVSPYIGDAIPKKQMRGNEHLSLFPLYHKNVASKFTLPLKMRLVCVQDPFEHSHNVASCVSRPTFARFLENVRRAASIPADAVETSLMRELLLTEASIPHVVIKIRSGAYPRRHPAAIKELIFTILRDVLKLSLSPLDDRSYDGTLECDVFDRKHFESLYRNRNNISFLELQKQVTESMIRLGTNKYLTKMRVKVRVFHKKGVRVELEYKEGEIDGFVALGRQLQLTLRVWLRVILQEEAEAGLGDGEAEFEGPDTEDSEGEYSFSDYASQDDDDDSNVDSIQLDKLDIRE